MNLLQLTECLIGEKNNITLRYYISHLNILITEIEISSWYIIFSSSNWFPLWDAKVEFNLESKKTASVSIGWIYYQMITGPILLILLKSEPLLCVKLPQWNDNATDNYVSHKTGVQLFVVVYYYLVSPSNFLYTYCYWAVFNTIS